MLNAALWYVEHGFSVIPISTKKIPLVKWVQYQEEKASEKQVSEWWGKNPDALIGLVTGKISGITVIDLDSQESIQHFNDILPDNLLTPIASTPRGGQHLYFRYTPDLHTVAGIIPQTDIRNDRGIIIAPPSRNGKKGYTWLDRLKITDVPLAEIPDNIIKVFNNSNIGVNNTSILNNIYIGGDSKRQQVTAGLIKKGTRDNAFFHLANCLTKGKTPPKEIESILTLMANYCCEEPFPSNEIPVKIKSVLDRVERQQRHWKEEVIEILRQQSGSVTTAYVQQATASDSRAEKKIVNDVLSRLAKEKNIIEHAGIAGTYRIISKEYEEKDWKASTDSEFKVKLPMGLSECIKVRPGSILCFAAGPNVGKALRNGTPVLVDKRGWIPIEKLTENDKVFGIDGKMKGVLGLYPQGVRKCYRFTFNDGTWIDSDEDHIWTLKTKEQMYRRECKSFSEFINITTKEIVTKYGIGDILKKAKHPILPLIQPIEFDHQPIPLDPYLLGVLLGDGCFSMATPKISTGDKEIIELFRKHGYIVNHDKNYDYRVLGIFNAVRVLKLENLRSHEKYVPECYLFNSITIRKALLQGLMDTDGSISYSDKKIKSLGIEFCSTSEALAENVAFLVRSLGGKATVKNGGTTTYAYKGEKKNGKIRFRVNIKANFALFRLRRKLSIQKKFKKHLNKSIKSISELGFFETTCIRTTAEDGLFIAKDFIPTHNTAMAMDFILANASLKPIYFSSETDPSEYNERAKAREHISLWPDKFINGWTSTNIQDIIDADGVNVIDYLEPPGGDYTKMATKLTEIHHALRTGIAIIMIQVRPKKNYTKTGTEETFNIVGGQGMIEKPQLFCSMKITDFPVAEMRIIKAKATRYGFKNPYDKFAQFKVNPRNGCELIPITNFSFDRWNE